MHTTTNHELLIASLTPQNLERGVLWFSENHDAIKKARLTNPWWRDNSVLAEPDVTIKPSEFARRLLDLGYERGASVYGSGVFAVRGNVIEVWPVNTKKPYLIEFTGNTITLIREREEARERTRPRRLLAQSAQNLPVGSYIVHEDHGVGILRGFVQKNELSIPTSQFSSSPSPDGFFVVEYAPPTADREPDRLYVPLQQEERLTPYIGFETPRIHRLGGTLWQNTKRKVREETEKLARALLALYAKRYTASRAPHPGDPALEQELRDSFRYQETEDQLRAEEEILADLAQEKPMDRVLCGDVGFGKTEVAIRASLRVIASGKQVAVLAPTTVLAVQHEKTFQERLSRLPIAIRTLSRLAGRAEEKKILAELKEGRMDCVIGTHRLLSRDVEFKNLGLVIIDEEQRFGVKQKERFKELRAEVDILSLSATPIPRTLQLALANLREISFIKTPPPERLAIHTFVLPYSPTIIRNAIRQELARGGQVYVLHNRIETIGRVQERLKKLSSVHHPATIGILHGRMGEKEIVRTLNEFREKKIRVLIATTIIENGLDISNANTLIVDDATRLGLAEAHQLRGRIGRSKHQAFAYFLYRPRRMSEKAAERLEALKEYSELGAGYEIALRDLEIRGAGNILGAEQSGAINRVGLNLYCQMLAEAVDETRTA